MKTSSHKKIGLFDNYPGTLLGLKAMLLCILSTLTYILYLPSLVVFWGVMVCPSCHPRYIAAGHAVLFTAVTFYFYIWLQTTKQKNTLASLKTFFIVQYFLLTPLSFMYFWSKTGFQPDGQLLLTGIVTTPLVSWVYILLGVLYDVIENRKHPR